VSLDNILRAQLNYMLVFRGTLGSDVWAVLIHYAWPIFGHVVVVFVWGTWAWERVNAGEC
jgi:hypothetical protein